MPIISLENNGLRDAVVEVIRQASEAAAKISCGTGLSVAPEFDVNFSATVVVKGGLNAVPRVTTQKPDGERETVSIADPVTETSTRKGKSKAKSKSKANSKVNETQEGTSEESGTSKSTSKVTEKGDSKSTQTDKATNDQAEKTEGTNEVTDEQKSEQVQTHGTKQTTTSDYAR